MPSPIAHSAMGYMIFEIYRYYVPSHPLIEKYSNRILRPIVVIITLSLLPDLDIIPGILLGNFNQFHNNLTHSLGCGVIVALCVGGVIWLSQRKDFLKWFFLVLICYEVHVIMDFFTYGRGVMLFWPVLPERFEPPFQIFYGLRRDDGLITFHHLWTLINELSFFFVTLIIASLFRKLEQGKKNVSMPITESLPWK